MATFDKVTANNNGVAGILIQGDGEGLHFKDVHVEGNGVAGILFLDDKPLIQALGLPDDTDPKDLLGLLKDLQGKGELDRRETAAKHTFVEKYSKRIADMTSFLANLAKISEASIAHVIPYLQQSAS